MHYLFLTIPVSASKVSKNSVSEPGAQCYYIENTILPPSGKLWAYAFTSQTCIFVLCCELYIAQTDNSS